MKLPLEAKRLDAHHSCIYDADGMLVVPRMATENKGPQAEDIAAAVNTAERNYIMAQRIAAARDMALSALRYLVAEATAATPHLASIESAVKLRRALNHARDLLKEVQS